MNETLKVVGLVKEYDSFRAVDHITFAVNPGEIGGLLGPDLDAFAKTKAGLLSSGELTRLNLAKALINEPSLLLLDEPTASLDPSVANLVRERMKNWVAQRQTTGRLRPLTYVINRRPVFRL
ncbi:MAG: ATP-binding cassette domain-containing protein [Sedimentisphaerales bacterium]|nr:ATP-binding cassette domain-containing protein [Sedimentisphaerales bacterium]